MKAEEERTHAALEQLAASSSPSASDRRLAELLETIDAVVWEADAHRERFTYVSPRAEAMLGHPVRRWLAEEGFWQRELLHPEDREQTTGWCRSRSDAGRDHDVEYRAVTADGGVVWIRDVVTVLRDEQGRPARTRGVMFDITERKMAERRRAVQLAVTRVLAEARSLEEAAPRILQGICQALDWAVGELWLVDRSADVIRCEEIWNVPELDGTEFVDHSWRFRFRQGDGLPGRIWDTGRPIWISDVTTDDRFPRSQLAVQAGLRSAFGFPISARGEILGSVELFGRRVHERDEELLELAAAVGSQIGQFVERRAVENEVRFQKTLLEFQSEATPDGILLVGPTGRVLFHNRRFLDMWSLTEDVSGTRAELTALPTMRRLVADGRAVDAMFDGLRTGAEDEMRSEVELIDGRILDVYCSPVIADDGAYYGRCWYFRDVTPERRGERALRENEERLRFLARASALLASSLDVQGTLDSLARLVVQQLGDWSLVDVLERDGDLVRGAAAHRDPELDHVVQTLAALFPPDPDRPFGPPNVARTGQAELYEELPPEVISLIANDPAHSALVDRLGMVSAMSVPLIAKGRILGVLTVVSSDPDRRYGDADMSLVRDLAFRAALAMDTARLYQEWVRVARTLQQSLLPPASPQIPNLEVAARFHPAGEGTEIGGDFYDVFQTGENVWAVTLGDVVGKGTQAAAITALARYTIRASAMRPGKPSEILRMLNDTLLSRDTPDRYCTAVYAQVEPDGANARVTLTCGGHPAPYLLRSTGEAEKLDCLGTVLGLFEDISLRDIEVELQPGDALVFYTDGVTEGRGPTVPFGEGMLKSLLEWSVGSSADELAGVIESKVLDYQQGWASDDIAVLVVRLPA
ncbi:MAG TPA: SpoIIE family protein phosphatase [Actinomycetota bacterium]|nr:SpoIIE family protein phosphatase [Actinomycetota bacterium]